MVRPHYVFIFRLMPHTAPFSLFYFSFVLVSLKLPFFSSLSSSLPVSSDILFFLPCLRVQHRVREYPRKVQRGVHAGAAVVRRLERDRLRRPRPSYVPELLVSQSYHVIPQSYHIPWHTMQQYYSSMPYHPIPYHIPYRITYHTIPCHTEPYRTIK